jgi:hypothetical protein
VELFLLVGVVSVVLGLARRHPGVARAVVQSPVAYVIAVLPPFAAVGYFALRFRTPRVLLSILLVGLLVLFWVFLGWLAAGGRVGPFAA